MITATEIRYGNWVQNQNGYPIRVNYHFFGMIERLGKDHSEACSGIPLTPEVLEKCGFVKGPPQPGGYHGYSNGAMELDDHCTFGLYDGRMDDGATKFYGPPLDFLHQLQNLYFALTGEELTYTP